MMQHPKLSCAFSTCPNDTFIFCDMVRDGEVEVEMHDVETLNRMAFEERFDVTKLSFHAWLLLQDRYALLQTGAALGRGCGPLVITKGTEMDSVTIPHLRRCGSFSVPGEYTTAHLLLRLWAPEVENRIFMPFDQIMDAVASGRTDAGVIIHEGRFVYRQRGFHCIVDLGDWWEQETGLPIPLGCIAVRKSLGAQRIAQIEARLRRSVRAALDDPSSTDSFVKAHAQELDDEVIRHHIGTYVNDFTLDLGDEGLAAVDALQQRAIRAGILDG